MMLNVWLRPILLEMLVLQKIFLLSYPKFFYCLNMSKNDAQGGDLSRSVR